MECLTWCSEWCHTVESDMVAAALKQLGLYQTWAEFNRQWKSTKVPKHTLKSEEPVGASPLV